MLHHVIVGVIELPGHRRGNRLELGRAAELNRRLDLDHIDAIQSGQKIVMPKGAAVLAIGHRFQAHRFLRLDGLPNAVVFNLSQALGRQDAIGMLPPGRVQGRWPEQAAHMIRTRW